MQTTSEPAIPPRFRWLKRGGGAAVALLVFVVIVHVALGRWAKAKIEAQRLEWVAAGNADPRDAMAGNPPPLVGDDNAAVVVEQAMKQLPGITATQSRDWDSFPSWSPPFKAPQEAALRSIVEQDRAALALFRTARERPRIDFGYQAVAISGLLPRLNEYRNLANHLSFAATLAAYDGDLASAVGYIADCAWLGQAMVGDGETIVTSLVSTGISASAAGRVRKYLTIDKPGGLEGEAERAAWRAMAPEVRRLIALLLDADFDRDLRVRGFRGEFSGVYSYGDFAAGTDPLTYNVLVAPFVDADVARTLEHKARDAAAMRHLDDYAAVRAQLKRPAVPRPQSLAGATAHGAGAALEPSLNRAATAFFRVVVERRAAAAMLAVKLYAADHDGRLPQTLDELVPDYLPFVPIDPMSPDGVPMAYRVEDGSPSIESGLGFPATNPSAE